MTTRFFYGMIEPAIGDQSVRQPPPGRGWWGGDMADLILAVEDDTAVLQGIELLLEQAGYAVCSATTGAQAIELLSTPPFPALVVLDVLLPIHDGFAVCRHIRGLPSYIPVLMLSARADVTDKVLGLELGADDYLTKPFEPRELIAHIRALLRFKQHAISNLRCSWCCWWSRVVGPPSGGARGVRSSGRDPSTHGSRISATSCRLAWRGSTP